MIISFAIGKTIETLARQYIKQHPEKFPDYIKKHPDHFIEYLKDNPDFLEDQDSDKKLSEPELETKNKLRRLIDTLLRIKGGNLFFNQTTLVEKIITMAAEHAIATALTAGTAISSGILAKPAENFLHNLKILISEATFPHTIGTQRKRVIEVKKRLIDFCDKRSVAYLNTLYQAPKVMQEMTREEISKEFDPLFKTINFKIRDNIWPSLFCIISLLIFFYSNDEIAFFQIIMTKLRAAIQEGKIPKKLVKIIVKKLGKRKIPVPPDILDFIEE